MSYEREPNIYGIDFRGKVWVFGQGKHQRSAPQCTLLPNPTRIDFKRVSSLEKIIWGISSDHQIYIYVLKQDIPIKVTETTFENQRWNPLGGFCNDLLPTDRRHFSNEEGTQEKPKESIILPSKSWAWENEWAIENTFENQLLEAEGWTYAIDFPATYHPEKSWKSCVRRRKWFRARKYHQTNTWNLIDSLHNDFTSEPFIDVSIGCFGISHQDIHCVWAVSVIGQVYFRVGVTPTNPEGTKWKQVTIKKGFEACQVNVTANGVPLVVTWTGQFLYRSGLTPYDLEGDAWIEANGPTGGLIQLAGGCDSLWGITRDKKCWALKSNLHLLITENKNNFDWIEIPGSMRVIFVNSSDQVVLALSEDETSSILSRFGITKEQKHGQGWKEVVLGVAPDNISITSSDSSIPHQPDPDGVDMGGIGDKNDSDSSSMSIRPDIPQGFPVHVDMCDGHMDFNFAWIDGGCHSLLKSGAKADIEIGPWRNEILNELNSLKTTREGFQYPNAVDPINTNWTKVVSAKMLKHMKGFKWVKGQLEISNNDTLVFYKDLHTSWMCAIVDILSVMVSGETTCITLRIRNSIEAGVADFISFKFLGEKDMEEWRTVLNELSNVGREDFTISNIWLTSNSGEVYKSGLLKMKDSPIEAELNTESEGSSMLIHYPLLKGFLPGSELLVDIILPSGVNSFSLNLCGRDSNELVPFHFNPRLADKVVVRNTMERGEWGDEERDGVFPFVAGNSYKIHIQCNETHIFTTVISKHKFIFKYKQRIFPKFIVSFNAYGDISITSIRYDPQIDNNVQIEFVTKVVPGHFWKAESYKNGYTWAIGCDLNVWCYTGGNSSADTLNMTTDDQSYYTYENQRWNPLSGFGAHGLPSDRYCWSDETGRIQLEKDNIKLPSTKWNWVTEWEIDYDLKEGVDSSGWQYAIDFPASYHPNKRINDFVRRRRWKRTCRYSELGPWIHVEGIKLVDLCIRMSEEFDIEVLGACQDGDAVVRKGITQDDPLGTHWEPISTQKPIISISGYHGQKDWAVGKDGFAYICYQGNWSLLDRPKDAPIRSISVGPMGIWALGTNNVLYRRAEVQPHFPEGREWLKVVDGVLNITLSPEGFLYALLRSNDVYKCRLSKRLGVSESLPNGLGWETIAEGPWKNVSMCGALRRGN